MTDWISVYLRALGARPSQVARDFLSRWQPFEGGETHNNAKFNYLNTTMKMPGSRSINSVGVQAYVSLAQGAQAFAKTLTSNPNYSGIVQLLRTGSGDPAPGLSTWLSGSPSSPHGLAYASKVTGAKVSAPAAPTGYPGLDDTGLAQQAQSGAAQIRKEATAGLGRIATGESSATDEFSKIPTLIQSVKAAAAATPQVPSAVNTPFPSSPQAPAQPAAPSGKFTPGVPVSAGTSIGGEHPTMGLDGYPAKDYFAPSGSEAVAPVSGKVIRLSGHDPAEGPVQGPHGPLGWSVYIQGDDGHIYYLTHMGSRSVQVGQAVKAGQPIGTVADYAKYGTPSHIHMGVH